MCLAIPGKILKINSQNAVVDYGGIKKDINISFVNCNIGDYVLVHSGFAIEVIDKDRAEDFLKMVLEND
ncbi:MAG: HypC/HybG/HupF family hydrogenase formation chaperone [Nanoarchaeota archaeon]